MKIIICPPPFRPTGFGADLSFIIFPRRENSATRFPSLRQ
jgi:hypothetical protein